MKYSILAFFLSVAMVVMLNGCKKDDDDPSNKPAITSGVWMVHLFTDSGTDETSDFAGYDFVFTEDGKITATKAGVSTPGTWSTRTDDGMPRFDLNMSGSDPVLLHLNNDWVIFSSTITTLDLGDDNGASGEVLHFRKK